MKFEKKFKEIKKGKKWCIEGKYEMAVENIGYKQMLDYCRVIYLMGYGEDIYVDYFDENKYYKFRYDYDFDTLYLEEEEEY
jgi:hypothetical protein